MLMEVDFQKRLNWFRLPDSISSFYQAIPCPNHFVSGAALTSQHRHSVDIVSPADWDLGPALFHVTNRVHDSCGLGHL